jgi:DNA-binding XRE family transcriptional regulator
LKTQGIMTAQASYNIRIVKDKIKAARVHNGLRVEHLAQAVCLSTKNIVEIEESETYNSFYSYPVKVTAAKRVGRYLGLNESEFLEVMVNE